MSGIVASKDSQSVEKISSSVTTARTLKAGMALSLAKSYDTANLNYMDALHEENMMIIRRQDKIIELLEAMYAKE